MDTIASNGSGFRAVLRNIFPGLAGNKKPGSQIGAHQRNASLDTLRAFAVIIVFIHHLIPGDYTGLGARGVDLFFVLSGYLIGGIVFATVREQGSISPVRFWRDRWLRTLPAYFAVLILYIGKEIMDHGSVLSFIPYTLFLQSYVFAPGQLPAFHHSWSLCVEEHFYLALPLLVFLLVKFGRRNLVLPAISVLGISLLLLRVVTIEHGGFVQMKLSHWRTDGLVIGVLLAGFANMPGFRSWLVRSRHILAVLAIAMSVFACWVDLLPSYYFQTPMAIACGLLVVLGVINYAPLEFLGTKRVIAWIARISYSIYLVHPLVMVTLDRWNLSLPVYSAASILGTLIFSELLYRFVELPGLALRKRLRSRDRKAQTSGQERVEDTASRPGPVFTEANVDVAEAAIPIGSDVSGLN